MVMIMRSLTIWLIFKVRKNVRNRERGCDDLFFFWNKRPILDVSNENNKTVNYVKFRFTFLSI